MTARLLALLAVSSAAILSAPPLLAISPDEPAATTAAPPIQLAERRPEQEWSGDPVAAGEAVRQWYRSRGMPNPYVQDTTNALYSQNRYWRIYRVESRSGQRVSMAIRQRRGGGYEAMESTNGEQSWSNPFALNAAFAPPDRPRPPDGAWQGDPRAATEAVREWYAMRGMRGAFVEDTGRTLYSQNRYWRIHRVESRNGRRVFMAVASRANGAHLAMESTNNEQSWSNPFPIGR